MEEQEARQSEEPQRTSVSNSIDDTDALSLAGLPTGGAAQETGERKGRKKKRRSLKWSDLSYTMRMALAFAAIAAMTALVAIGVLSFVWNQHFQTYTRENMESTATSTAERIAESYASVGGWAPETTAMAAYVSITYPGIGVSVADEYGIIRYDSMLTQTDRSQSSSNAQQYSLAPIDSSQVASAPIEVNGKTVGTVRVWVYGSETMLRQTDREFRDNSYQAMFFASILAIVLASCIGFIFARNLVSPINRMTRTAQAIKDGDLSARTGLTGDDEIARLGETFDEMADSVEKDRELERRLTTDVAHELRTPLMAIQSTVEAMVDGVLEADEERLETIDVEVQRLSRLVNAILKLSRLENRSTPLKEEEIDVGDIVEGIVATHEAFVTDSGLTLEHNIEPDVKILGDADMIRQATANLISNAVRYTPEGGTITVSVRRGEIMASICVEDTGIGLTPEEAKMVFSRFWRADSGRTRESGGLGIGLSVVKEIVDRHHGWVKVEGQPNVGARFTIYIPLLDSKVTQQRLRQNEKANRARGLGKSTKMIKTSKVTKSPKPNARASKDKRKK